MGDVVGVLKIVRPLDREIESTRAGLRGAFMLMGTIATLLVVRQRRRDDRRPAAAKGGRV